MVILLYLMVLCLLTCYLLVVILTLFNKIMNYYHILLLLQTQKIMYIIIYNYIFLDSTNQKKYILLSIYILCRVLNHFRNVNIIPLQILLHCLIVIPQLHLPTHHISNIYPHRNSMLFLIIMVMELIMEMVSLTSCNYNSVFYSLI